MSLYKQLWIAIAVLMLVVFGVTFFINGLSSSSYLEQQLSIKNEDDANGLALSWSQQSLDEVTLEVQLKTLADLSAYELVEFRSPTGSLVYTSRQTLPEETYTQWLKSLFPINSIVGSHQVDNGWNQIGTLYLKSHDGFAYDELWASGKRMLFAILIAIVIAGAIGTLILRVILRPLDQVVSQAEAIGERRFISLDEPRTTEFARVTRSMNELSRRVKEMLLRESQRLERSREANEIDQLTGIMLRDPFMRRLRAKLDSEDSDARGSMALLRINNLAQLNQLYGRNTLDNLLKEIGHELRKLTLGEDDWNVGRLNGSDFCMLAPQNLAPLKLGESIQRTVSAVLQRYSLVETTTLPTASVDYLSGDSIGSVMTALDGAMMSSDHQEDAPVTLATRGSQAVVPVRQQSEYWLRELTTALNEKRLLLQPYSVVDTNGQIIHDEGMLRIRGADDIRNAGEFMPWVHRLDLSGEIDRAVVQLALDQIRKTDRPTCVNLSATSLTDPTFSIWLEELLIKNTPLGSKLSLEVGEAMAYAHTAGFRRLSQRVHTAGCKLGVEHMGYRISDIGKLSELGVDYMKVDGLFIREIDSNEGNKALLRTYANIAQSLGVPCIAEGVNNQAELIAVFDCAATGATGKGVS